MKQAWQVKTYVDIAETGLVGIMPLIEVTIIFERPTPPPEILIQTAVKVLVPEGRALISEVIKIPHDTDTP